MATASNATSSAGESSNVPQWKRDLIQRRRQQSKVLASNGASVKLCSAVIGSAAEPVEQTSDQQPLAGSVVARVRLEDASCCVNVSNLCSSSAESGGPSAIGGAAVSSSFLSRPPPACGAILCAGALVEDGSAAPVACNMRLEADLSVCSDAEDVASSTLLSSKDTSGKQLEEASETEDTRQQEAAKMIEDRTTRTNNDFLLELSKTRRGSRTSTSCEDPESDSSEELQYGPGIVNKLKSKYLNLTLKEMNKSRVSVQRFRRAASLEDLLDCEDEPGEKVARKYAKRNAVGAVTAKTDRYRNASRGNESMKRARSVETLMRYNAAEDVAAHHHLAPGRSRANGALRQEPINDHIILIDRSSVKIESRLGDVDRPKPVNKPKRIKPLLAETERPPPDLVKTTMRIFEGSAKKLNKPKGEVAAKVATFKTINDTFKAQTQKKIVPKPPIQPKPFVNGNSRPPLGSPKKIVLPQKSTAELLETQEGQEEYRVDGVLANPIVQSVSSVVSKFQQIEKSHSPSPSPEPSFRFKFSPAPSPEPSLSKLKSSLEISIKSPPVTPILSPRISSPRLQSPSSPMKDILRQNSPRVQLGGSPPSPVKDLPRQNSSPQARKLPPMSPSRDLPRQFSAPESTKSRVFAEEASKPLVEHARQFAERVLNVEKTEDTMKSPIEDEQREDVDGPKTISKSALDNIGRAGSTMQFSFGDKPTSNKTYLPGSKQNGQKSMEEDTSGETKQPPLYVESRGKAFLSGAPASTATVNTVTDHEAVTRLQERLEPDKRDRTIEEAKEDVAETKPTVIDNKPIGAICSLGLIKSSTTTSYSQGNESKTIRSQKTESSPPQKQIGIIRPLVSTKTQHPQQNLSNRELEKNLINRVKSIEQPTKVVVSLKSADEIQPAKKSGAGGGGGLWDTKPWNQQNNSMVFNFSNRKDVPDYIENDGLIIKRKREKTKVGDGGIIVLDATLDASTTDDSDWELSGGPPSPCDVSFLNDNVLINGRSNLSRTPRNHKHRIKFDDTATRTFEYPSEASMFEGESSSVDGETSGSVEQSTPISNKTSPTNSTTTMPSLLGGGGGLASYTPSKVDLTAEGFELGVTRAVASTPTSTSSSTAPTTGETENESEMNYLKPAQDAGAWGSETTGDLLY